MRMIEHNPGAGGDSVPTNWTAAFAHLAEQVAAAIVTQRDAHAREIGDLRQQVMDLTSQVRLLTDARAADREAMDQAVAAARSQVDEIRTETAAAATQAAKDLADSRGQVDELRAQLAKVVQQVTDLAGAHDVLVRDGIAGTDRALADLGARLDTLVDSSAKALADVLQTVDERVAELRAADTATAAAAREICAENGRITDKQLEALQNALDKASAAAAETFSEIGAEAKDLRSLVSQLADARVAMSEQIAGVQKYTGDCFNDAMQAVTDTEQKAADALNAINQRIDGVVDRINEDLPALRGDVTDLQTVSETVSKIGDTTEELTTNVNAALDRLAEAIAEMPRNHVISRQGHLLVFNGRGDEKDLGLVCGRDGTSASGLVAVKAEGSRLIFIRGDGGEFACDLPEAVAPAVTVSPAPIPPKHDVDDMVEMRKNGATWKQIGDKHGITGVHAGRLVKKATGT